VAPDPLRLLAEHAREAGLDQRGRPL